MTLLESLFGTRAQSGPKQRSRQARPTLESLEAREVLTVTYHGGAVLPHVEVQGLYYGRDWSTNQTLYNQTGYLEGYLKYVVSSPYVDLLTNAGYGVGRGTFTPGRIDLSTPNKANYLSDGTIRTELQALISNRSLATPDANRLYVVFVEPGVAVRMADGSNSIRDFLGYHGAFAGRDASGRSADVRYAVIAYPGGAVRNATIGALSAAQQLTEVSSHELAEAVTDPDVNYKRLGWYDDRLGEIGDIVNGQFVVLNGYVVQKEAGKNDQALSPAGSRPFSSFAPVASQLSSIEQRQKAADTLFSQGFDLVH